MVRSAAKNWRDVGVVVDPADYQRLADELAAQWRPFGAARASRWRRRRSRIRRPTTARSATGCRCATPTATSTRSRSPCAGPARKCRRCAMARIRTSAPRSTATRRRPPARSPGTVQRQGKELSYNNIADSDAAWECVKTFDAPACVIVKHANPCGVALGDDTAWRLSRRVRHRSRPARSAASSRSTGRSTRPRWRRCRRSSSKC